jgi:hypothetical protein
LGGTSQLDQEHFQRRDNTDLYNDTSVDISPLSNGVHVFRDMKTFHHDGEFGADIYQLIEGAIEEKTIVDRTPYMTEIERQITRLLED